MADNKSKRDGRDRAKVDRRDPSEVEYLHSRYPKLSHQQISGAVRAAGPVRAKIVQYIKLKYGV